MSWQELRKSQAMSGTPPTKGCLPFDSCGLRPAQPPVVVKEEFGRTQRLRAFTNRAVGNCLHLTDLETNTGTWLRFTVALAYLGLALGGILVWRSIYRRLHVLYWISHWPQSTLFSTMLALCASFLILTRVRISRHFSLMSIREEDDTDEQRKSPEHHLKKLPKVGRLRPMAGFGVFLALGAFFLGALLVIVGMSTEAALRKNCGTLTSPQTRLFQDMSDQLGQFQKDCVEKNETVGSLVKCPGFSKQFPYDKGDRRENVDYLIRLQTNEGCTGFCAPGAPLNVEERSVALDEQLTCAEVVGRDVRYITLLVGVPSIVLGLILAVVDFSLFEYDNL